LVSKKDELLQGLDSGALLELAKSVSGSPIKSGATRANLLKIVKESLSVEEIKRKVKQMKRGPEAEELTRDELTSGGVGQLLLAISGAINVIAYFVTLMVGGTLNYYQAIAPWGLVSSVIFLIFAILLRVSIVKIAWKLGSSGVGTATSLFGLIAALTGIVYYVLTILGVTTVQYFGVSGGLNILGLVLAISYTLLVGITMALLGVFFLLCREYSPSSELWMAGGIIYIVAGASEFSLLSSLYLPAAPFVAGIIGATCFLARKAAR